MHYDLFNTSTSANDLFGLDDTRPAVEALSVSPWVAMSALQKAIRRNDVNLALGAATTLLAKEPAKLWRRLAGIVFEDIGLGSIETIKLVIEAIAAKSLPAKSLIAKSIPTEHNSAWALAAFLIERMCAAPKCRACDDLFISVSTYHKLEDLRASIAGASLQDRLTLIASGNAILGASLAALHASGVRWNGQIAGQASNAKAVFAIMRSNGIAPETIALSELGFRKTREALPLLFPLLSAPFPTSTDAVFLSHGLTVKDDNLPPVVLTRYGVPTYCLDAFSMEGKAALARFLRRDTATARFLNSHVSAERRLAVLAGGLFRIEGGLVRQRIEWPCAITLRWLADSGYHGMNLADPVGFLDMIHADLPLLDEERANVR